MNDMKKILSSPAAVLLFPLAAGAQTVDRPFAEHEERGAKRVKIGKTEEITPSDIKQFIND
jgi:hypothetical protein